MMLPSLPGTSSALLPHASFQSCGRSPSASLKNKLLFLLPAALALSLLAPWAIMPLLMIGGAYLCYEGVEKVYEAVWPGGAQAHESKLGTTAVNAQTLEDEKVASAIKTDFILSAEIMAITLAAVPGNGLVNQAVVLAVVGIGITAVVYGGVAVIVKADDIGVALARSSGSSSLSTLAKALGRGLVLGMPVFLKVLGVIGTAAMIWVGGGIIVHGLEGYGMAWMAGAIHRSAELAARALPAAAARSRMADHCNGFWHGRPDHRWRSNPGRRTRHRSRLESPGRAGHP